MNEREVGLKLSEIKIDNDNLDYMKLVGEICGKLRDDLVKLFSTPDTNSGSYTLLGSAADLLEEIKTEDCIIESAFLFENGARLIVGTSCQYGITTYSCDENWRPVEYACKGGEMIGFDSYTDFHKHIRKMHGEENLVKERSSELAW